MNAQVKLAASNIHPFPQDSYHKRMIALRYWLQGRQYYNALIGLKFNHDHFKDNIRKDGSNAFDHHVFQANYIRCFDDMLTFPEETITLAFFHDTQEDKGVHSEEIAALFPHSPEFGMRIVTANALVTKEFRGVKVANEEAMFMEMAKNPISSVLKGVDRIHNLQSMFSLKSDGNPVFSIKKQHEYIEETQNLILPMLKLAISYNPQQEPIYQIIRTNLKMQCHTIKHHLDSLANA